MHKLFVNVRPAPVVSSLDWLRLLLAYSYCCFLFFILPVLWVNKVIYIYQFNIKQMEMCSFFVGHPVYVDPC